MGYVLALKYTDQLTGGALNLLSLMCLATEFGGVRVVEPFVVNSDFGLNASKRWTEQLKFRDINDISVWEKYVSIKRYSQFVPYETFMQDAPRKVLLVQYYYPCGDRMVWSMAREFCDSNGFELVGKVCLVHGTEETISVKNQIYSHFKKTDVVVLFEIFGGIIQHLSSVRKPYRILARKTMCDRHTFSDHNAVQPSPSVFSDANAYIQRFVKGNSTYISVMVRLERILRISNAWNGHNATECARQCLNSVLRKWRDIKEHIGIATTFLAIDVGTYGSKELHTFEIEKAVLPPVEEFFSAVYDNKTSLQEWEDSFSSVGLGRTRNPGYIATMQKVIAARGDILMLVGSTAKSAFQITSKALYHKIHGKGQVIEFSSKCT